MSGIAVGRRSSRTVGDGVLAVFDGLICVAMIGVFGVADTHPSRAAGGLTALAIDGEVRSIGMGGDEVGKSFVIFEADAASVTGEPGSEGSEREEARIVFDAPGVGGAAGNGYWTIHLAAPRGTVLSPGSYTGATWAPGRDGDEPGINISGNDEDCGFGATGDFTIHEISISDGVLHSLSASFRQTCEPSGPFPPRGDLFGEVRFHAFGGFRAAEARPWTLDFGQQATGTSAGTRDITVTSTGTQSIHLGAASVTGSGASSFTIESDACSGSTLDAGQRCVVRVSATPSRNEVLEAVLEMADDTHRGRRQVPMRVEGLGSVDATVIVSPSKFYPFPDGYLDRVEVTGKRKESASVDVVIRRASDPTMFVEASVPSGLGAYRVAWFGWFTEEGLLAPQGDYAVEVTLRDADGNRGVVERHVTLSHDWVSWEERTASLSGKRFSLWGRTKNAQVSLTESSYRDGVRLISNRGFATVVYALPVSPSHILGAMSFDVEGRSTNRHKALIAIWNPKLGGYLDLDHYDAATTIGPDYGWWSTSTRATGRARNGKAWAAVMVWKGLGGAGASTFDLRRVRLVYQVGRLQNEGDASVASARPTGSSRAMSRESVRDLAEGTLPDLRRASALQANEAPWPTPTPLAPEEPPGNGGPTTSQPPAADAPGVTTSPRPTVVPTPETTPSPSPEESLVPAN